MTGRALIVAMFAAVFVLALVLLRPQPSTTVADDGAENAQPPALAAAERESAAIDAGLIAAAVANVPPELAEAAQPTPATAPLPTGFAPSVVADVLATSGTGDPLPLAASVAERERLFAEETADPDWAPRVESEILSGFAQQTGLALMSLQVECRATLCRVQMTQTEREGPHSNPLRFLSEIGLYPLQGLVLGRPNGQRSSVAYVSRFPPTPPSPAPSESASPNPSRTDP